MPRRPKGDGEASQKTPRVRKKKESASICGTPSIDMKLEPANSLGFEQLSGSLGGNIQQQGPPHNIIHNGSMNAGNMFSPEEMAGQGPLPGQAGVAGAPHFSAGHPEYYYHHHGAPGGPIPPQISLPPSHPNMPLYGGSMMPQHPHQQPHLSIPQMQPQPFNDAEQQLSGPPFLYQQPMSGQPNAPPPGVPPLPGAQAGGAPPHLMMRQFAMTPLGPNFPQQPFLEYRLSEMNRRLYSFHTSQRTLPAQDHAQWWEAFSHEFFDDDARMTISLLDSDMTNRKYTIGRSLIPRYHRTIFDNGVTELFYVLRSPAQERINPHQWGMCALDCDNVLMVTRHDRPIPAEVHNECRLFLEFSPFEESIGYRIRHWAIEIRNTREYYSTQNGMDNAQQEFAKNKITRCGLPPAALHYLKLCLILEPMQILMQHSKANNNAPPRQSLSYILFNHHNRLTNMAQQHQLPPHINPGVPLNQPSMSVPQTPIQEEVATSKKPPRKRQRKNAANTGGTASSPKKKNAAAAAVATPPPQPQPSQMPANIALSQSQQPPGHFQTNHPAMAFNSNHLMYQDVMVVGEPSMMGCEFSEDDERAISRIENTQYIDPNSSVACSSGGAATSSLGQQGIL